MKNHYRTLGLPNHSSMEEIKKAYRSLALKFHPDRGGDVEKMKTLNEAYEFLIKNKEQYDQVLLQARPKLKTYGFTIVVNGYGFTSNNSTTGVVWPI